MFSNSGFRIVPKKPYPEMRNGIYAINHVPFISFDGDQADPKNFSPAQFETRVQGLIESIDQHRAEKEEAAK